MHILIKFRRTQLWWRLSGGIWYPPKRKSPPRSEGKTATLPYTHSTDYVGFQFGTSFRGLRAAPKQQTYAGSKLLLSFICILSLHSRRNNIFFAPHMRVVETRGKLDITLCIRFFVWCFSLGTRRRQNNHAAKLGRQWSGLHFVISVSLLTKRRLSHTEKSVRPNLLNFSSEWRAQKNALDGVFFRHHRKIIGAHLGSISPSD